MGDISVLAQKKMCDYQRGLGHVVICWDSTACPQTPRASRLPRRALGGLAGTRLPTARPVSPRFIGAARFGLHSRPATPIGAGRGYCIQTGDPVNCQHWPCIMRVRKQSRRSLNGSQKLSEAIPHPGMEMLMLYFF